MKISHWKLKITNEHWTKARCEWVWALPFSLAATRGMFARASLHSALAQIQNAKCKSQNDKSKFKIYSFWILHFHFAFWDLRFEFEFVPNAVRRERIFFFSSAYWDVSLQRVRPTLLRSEFKMQNANLKMTIQNAKFILFEFYIFILHFEIWDLNSRRNSVVTRCWAVLGFPIRKSPDQRLVATSPRLIAGTPRPSSPRPPKASTICS